MFCLAGSHANEAGTRDARYTEQAWRGSCWVSTASYVSSGCFDKWFTTTRERAVTEYSDGAGIERASLRRQLAQCGDFLGSERAVPDGNVVEVAAQ